MPKLRVLLLADDCNPEWPSLPIVGYKFALALGRRCDVTVATHIRNRENIEKAAPTEATFTYIDNEYIAAPMHKLSTWLRGGSQVAWSTHMIMNYLPYLAFERETWKQFREPLNVGQYDIVHRITPMTPTMPSYMAKRCPVPFALGPLNGNLDWPKSFKAEQKREKERLRGLRSAYRLLPYARSTLKNAAFIQAGFDHTIAGIDQTASGPVINFPEIGFDPKLFHANGRTPVFEEGRKLRFLFVGRLVPYKVAEVVVRAFAGSPHLANHELRIVGDGPERPRLQEIVQEEGATDFIHFDGPLPQNEVAEEMRRADAFVFPSIRELGAGVVVEAMACGCTCFVTEYGAPGHLAAQGRGHRIPLGPIDTMVSKLRQSMEAAAQNRSEQRRIATAGYEHAHAVYTWDRKAELTERYYQDLVAGKIIVDRGDYA